MKRPICLVSRCRWPQQAISKGFPVLALLAVLLAFMVLLDPVATRAEDFRNLDGFRELDGVGQEPGTGAGADPAAAGEPAASSGGQHEVVTGDSLWEIASQYYGDGGRWTEIYQANSSSIANPNLIFPGQAFTIPGSSPGGSEADTSGPATPVAPDAQGAIRIPVPHLYQYANPRMPGSTCGPTSLAMCLNYFGKNVTADELIEPVGCTAAEGTVIGNLAATARQYGFPNAASGNANSGYDLNWLNKNLAAGNPVIANIRMPSGSGHYMVVIGIDASGNYICNDPAKANAGNVVSPQELWNSWKNHHNCAAVVLK